VHILCLIHRHAGSDILPQPCDLLLGPLLVDAVEKGSILPSYRLPPDHGRGIALGATTSAYATNGRIGCVVEIVGIKLDQIEAV
jgi:hypothetical protein